MAQCAYVTHAMVRHADALVVYRTYPHVEMAQTGARAAQLLRDTTGLLRSLIDQSAQEAVLGLLIDPDSALRAHQAGQGATLEFSLGGTSAIPGDAPLAGQIHGGAPLKSSVHFRADFEPMGAAATAGPGSSRLTVSPAAASRAALGGPAR
jgi:microcystin degradation protein MlrC